MLLFLTGFSSLGVSQNILKLSNPNQAYQITRELQFLWNEGEKYSFQEILSSPVQDKFTLNTSGNVNFGLKKADLWMKVRIQNTVSESENDWILELAYPHFDSLEFYYKDHNGLWHKHLTGDLTPFNTRQIYNRCFAFPIALHDDSIKEFYIHIWGESSFQISTVIQGEDHYYRYQTKVNILYGGIFFGIIIIMLIYNAFIYFSLKDSNYLYFVIFNLGLMFFYLVHSGFGFQFAWADYPMLNTKMIPIGIIISGLTGTIFVRKFLETKKHAPKTNTFFTIIILAYVPLLLIVPFLSYNQLIAPATFLTTLSSVTIFIACYRLWFKGVKTARLPAIAFTGHIIGIILLTLNTKGLIDRNFIAAHSIELGNLLELILFSLALSDKYTLLRKEKEHTQVELIKLQSLTNKELEKTVEERTEQIRQQNLELKKSNQTKNTLLSIMSHDLKGPLKTFQAILNMMAKEEPTPEKIASYNLHLNNKLNQMIGLVDNILHWVRSQMDGITLEIKEVNLHTTINESIAALSNQAELKDIKITNLVPQGYKVNGDHNVILLVTRNLLANALKFTPNNGSVEFSAYKENGMVITEITDNGVGINPENLEKLFTDAHSSTQDTDHKGGTGLGLLLCKEFLQRTSGNIWVESEEGKGTTFRFSQPEASEEPVATSKHNNP
ncbi:MAG: 7TM diverse intracellular signaling domain-containing protein [Cytophagaceae bacterium]